MTDHRRAMRLLVSVANAADASAALAGGADVIDAKNPLAGALGPVSADVLREIHATVAGARLVTAAIGDASDETEIERAAGTFAAAGAALVKVGFAGITNASRIETAHQGGRARRPELPPVSSRWRTPTRDPVGAFVDVAARAGAMGVLLDTADKSGPGLRGLMTPTALARWVAEAHEGGIAGRAGREVDRGRSLIRARRRRRHRGRARRRVRRRASGACLERKGFPPASALWSG